MKFYNLESIVASQKVTYDMRMPTDSFYIAPPRSTSYIKPDIFKDPVRDREAPSSFSFRQSGPPAKSALAHVLSNSTRLPLLELGKHKPVGDNTAHGITDERVSHRGSQ